MEFAYSQYVYQCLILPLVIAAGLCCASVSGVYKVFRQVRKAQGLEIMMGAAGIFLLAALAFMHIGVLRNGGIHLLTERETDAQAASGKIEKVQQLTEWQFYNKYGDAVSFEIDGERYHVFSLGNIEKGDDVEITYLPESRYVLSVRLKAPKQ
ncbi:MAG: hypothetical protein IJE08_06895 [Clostridia bacterium]|nr:hypothetical protein [Clostridia bacterium]